MNVNGIGQQTYFDKTNKEKSNPKSRDRSFFKNLSENIQDKAGSGPGTKETAAKNPGVVSTAYSYRNLTTVSEAIEVEKNGKTQQSAVSICETRNLTYQKSDYAKSYAIQGFTLMAQVDFSHRSVYVEQKTEDGAVTGYNVDIDQVDAGTKDPIEKAALEAWEQEREDGAQVETELTLEEALLQFYEFIEDRIKNGPPKYQIGNSEFSTEEWEKFLEGIDEQIDEIKEDLRERIEKLKEQQVKAELAKGSAKEAAEARDSDEEELEEELLQSLFQNK